MISDQSQFAQIVKWTHQIWKKFMTAQSAGKWRPTDHAGIIFVAPYQEYQA